MPVHFFPGKAHHFQSVLGVSELLAQQHDPPVSSVCYSHEQRWTKTIASRVLRSGRDTLNKPSASKDHQLRNAALPRGIHRSPPGRAFRWRRIRDSEVVLSGLDHPYQLFGADLNVLARGRSRTFSCGLWRRAIGMVTMLQVEASRVGDLCLPSACPPRSGDQAASTQRVDRCETRIGGADRLVVFTDAAKETELPVIQRVPAPHTSIKHRPTHAGQEG